MDLNQKLTHEDAFSDIEKISNIETTETESDLSLLIFNEIVNWRQFHEKERYTSVHHQIRITILKIIKTASSLKNIFNGKRRIIYL